MEAGVAGKTIDYVVSGEPQSTEERTLTANQILQNAGFDPATNYLIEMRGHNKESYQGRGIEPIHMHPHMEFLAISLEPTTVSSKG